jgi:membrane-bound inhibitor of C-type lysozyme
MKRSAAAAFGLTVLTTIGCVGVLAEVSRSNQAKSSKDVFFSCDQDVRFEGTFVNEGEAKKLIVIFPEAAQPLTLPLVPAASGSRYDDGDLMIWIKGKEALVERGGKSLYTGCKVVGK